MSSGFQSRFARVQISTSLPIMKRIQWFDSTECLESCKHAQWPMDKPDCTVCSNNMMVCFNCDDTLKKIETNGFGMDKS